MPKISRRRYSISTSDEFGRIQNMSAPPRKVSFETASEDEESSQSSSNSITSLPTMSLDEENQPQEQKGSLRSFKRKEGGFMKRPTPSVCLSAMASHKRKNSSQCLHQVDAPIPYTSEPLSPCWGQFVDVIPDETESDSPRVPYNSHSIEESSSTYGYQPYPSVGRCQTKRRRALSPKQRDQLEEGFLPGFLLSVPCNNGETTQEQESSTTAPMLPKAYLSTRDVLGALQSLTF
mmetsp:Transcript_4739/g.6730  ORF Transcript_4739/g.6730 Transcript_4739/m.6730 type:complete len:234 (+) Transcript_4739:98-799(+)